MSDTFCKAPHTLLQAQHFMSLTTREPVAVSAQDKLLWMWMKDRHDYFTGEGKAWFDNQDAIAQACGCSLSTVKRTIGKFIEHGYVVVEKRRIHGCAFSNSMTITQDLILAPVAPLEAIPKPMATMPNLSQEHVPIALPTVVGARVKPSLTLEVLPPVQDMDDDAYDDSPEWMRGAA